MRVKLADGKVPTAIAITNSGEFALVTVWDTAAVRGQVAVVALADGCQWCDAAKERDLGAELGQRPARLSRASLAWATTSPAKVLGYVDLPDSVKAPTEISASTGKSHVRLRASCATSGTNDIGTAEQPRPVLRR
jgi:hypothetical protein